MRSAGHERARADRHPRGKRDDRERKVEPVAARRGEQQRCETEDDRAETHGPARSEPRGDDQSEERRREDRQRRDTEVRVRRSEERQLERRAEGPQIRKQEQEPDDPEGHLSDHARESIAWPPPSG
jgi:hypothetical protein